MRLRTLGPAAFAVGLLLVSTPAQAQPAVSVSEYLQRVERARTTALSALSAPSPARMQDVLNQLGLPLAVALASGEVRVERDLFLKELGGETANDFRAAAEHLAVVADQAREAMARPEPREDQLRSAVSRAYRDVATQRPGIIDRFRRLASDTFQWLVAQIFSFRGAGSVIAWVVVAALLLLLVPLVRRIGVVPDRWTPRRREREIVETD